MVAGRLCVAVISTSWPCPRIPIHFYDSSKIDLIKSEISLDLPLLSWASKALWYNQQSPSSWPPLPPPNSDSDLFPWHLRLLVSWESNKREISGHMKVKIWHQKGHLGKISAYSITWHRHSLIGRHGIADKLTHSWLTWFFMLTFQNDGDSQEKIHANKMSYLAYVNPIIFICECLTQKLFTRKKYCAMLN